MKRASAVQSAASVQMRDAARPTLSSEAPVFSSATRPGQVPEKVRRQQERVVLADDAVDGVRRVGPVDEHADHRVVDRPELGDRLVGTREVALDQVGRSPQLLAAPPSAARSPRAIAPAPTHSAWPDSPRARRHPLSSP